MSGSTDQIAAIVLAAGLSRRMGADNKLLLPYCGQPLVRHTASTLLRAGFARVIAVTGHGAPDVEKALAGLDIELCYNPDFAGGQMTSVVHGLRSLGDAPGPAMVALADMPYLQVSDYQAVAASFRQHGGDRIIVPHFQQERGNPIILPAIDVQAAIAGDINTGCRKLIREHPDRVFAMPVDSSAFVRDIDTSADYGKAVNSSISPAACCG